MMGKRLQNVVVINDKRYSVDTGELLDANKPIPKTQATDMKRLIKSNGPSDLRKPQQVTHHPHHVDLRQKTPAASAKPLKLVTLDNFAKPAGGSLAHYVTTKRPRSIKSHKPAAAVHSKVRTPKEAHQRIHQPHQPKISHIAIARHTHTAKIADKPRIALGAGHHESRRLRAAQHQRHEKISKFAAARRNYAVAPPKAEIEETVIELRKPAAAHPTIQERIIASQAALSANIAKHHPRHHQPEAEAKSIAATKVAPQTAVVKPSFLERIGIANKLAPAIAVSAVALILVGYITYLNMPNLALRVAANRAGFDASMPSYTPEGYSFDGPIAYNSGQITVDFRSNTNDSQAYSLSQRKSAWNSESLLENVVKPEDKNYLTFQDRGLTIYVYESQATWVNGGVWYTINTNSSQLNTEQLVKIASSL